MKRVLFLIGLLSLTIAATAKSPFVGTWEGKINDLPGVDVTIEDAADTVVGARAVQPHIAVRQCGGRRPAGGAGRLRDRFLKRPNGEETLGRSEAGSPCSAIPAGSCGSAIPAGSCDDSTNHVNE